MSAVKGGKRNLAGLSGLTDLSALQNKAKEDKVLELLPEQILVKEQVRTVFDGIEELAESFKNDKQQSPIIVSPMDPNTGLYELQKGERRLRAARLILGFKVKAIVDATQRSKSEAHASQLIENIKREDLLPHDLGRALKRIKQERINEGLKATGRELAILLSVPESYISKYLELSDVPDDLAQLINEKIVTDSEVIYGLKLIYPRSPALYMELMDQARNREVGLTRAIVRESLKIAKGQISPIVIPTGVSIEQVGQGGAPNFDEPLAVNLQPGSDADPSAMKDPLTTTGENISHAESFEGQHVRGVAARVGGSIPLEADGKNPPMPLDEPKHKEGKAKKLGKNDTLEISPTQLVIGISVSFSEKVLHGELLTDRVLGDTSKAWVRVMDGGKQFTKQVAVDDITITSLAALAPFN